MPRRDGFKLARRLGQALEETKGQQHATALQPSVASAGAVPLIAGPQPTLTTRTRRLLLQGERAGLAAADEGKGTPSGNRQRVL
jgi:hypothetical protein